MANYSKLVGPTSVLSLAIKVQIEAETKPKQAIWRLQLAHKLLERFPHQIGGGDASNLQNLLTQTISFAVGGFHHQSSEVRS